MDDLALVIKVAVFMSILEMLLLFYLHLLSAVVALIVVMCHIASYCNVFSNSDQCRNFVHSDSFV